MISSFLYSEVITIATGEWSPWVSENLKGKGIGAIITKKAFNISNIDTKFEFYPWKRTYVVAKTTKNDATGFWLKTKQREKDFYFSDAVFSIKNKLIYKKGKNIEFNSIQDLKKYKIAITRGYSYTPEIDEMIENSKLNVYVVNNDLAGLKQLAKKQNFDAFLCSFNVAKDLIKNKFSPNEQKMFEFSANDVFSKDVFLMVSKQHKDAETILNTFNKGLQQLKNDGVIEKIINDSY